ncbi:MAG: ATP synthase F1 subunit delta [Cyanobacteria bacterium SIG28]|nr:ATP synthase F1 subunit delta [Cyanobacteria bacterium SIG28]
MTSTVKAKNCELIAKRWALALMELACEAENVSKEDILDDLIQISETLNSSEELSDVINNPSVSTEEKQIVLCKIFQTNTMPIVYNFLFALNLRKRVGIIGEIAKEFAKELDRLKNITHVNITSAIELNEEKREEIKQKIAEKLHKDIVVDWGVDSEIIAGLIFNIDNNILDNSVRNKLEDLSRTIIKG